MTVGSILGVHKMYFVNVGRIQEHFEHRDTEHKKEASHGSLVSDATAAGSAVVDCLPARRKIIQIRNPSSGKKEHEHQW